MSIDLKQFGRSICIKRDDLEMSQKDLSEKLHISATHLSNIENGKSMPSFSTFIDICTVLKTNPDCLIGSTIYPEVNDEIIKKIERCSPEKKVLLSKFIDVLLEEN